MNPGVTEEVGSTARSFVTTMSSQPVMLGMVIVVLALIGMLWFTLRFAADARKNEFEMIFKQQSEFANLLARCTVAPTPGPAAAPFRLQSADETIRIVPLPPLPPEDLHKGLHSTMPKMDIPK
jgi:hypothetical protein